MRWSRKIQEGSFEAPLPQVLDELAHGFLLLASSATSETVPSIMVGVILFRNVISEHQKIYVVKH